MDLILIYPPHLIALACIYIASVHKDKETTAWFEELRVDMNVVSFFELKCYFAITSLCLIIYVTWTWVQVLGVDVH